jgi:hypothetical protein
MDVAQRRPIEGHASALAEHALECPKAQRADAERCEPPTQGSVEVERREGGDLRSRGSKDGDRLVPQPPDGVLKCGRRSCVQPVCVVDRDQQRPDQRQRPDRLQCGGSDGALFGRPIVLAADEKRQFECSPLRWRQSGQDEPQVWLEQIRECGKGKANLTAGRPAFDDPEPACSGARDRRLPDRRLSDARLSLYEQPGGQRANAREERIDRRELTVAPDDRVIQGFHPAIMRRRVRSARTVALHTFASKGDAPVSGVMKTYLVECFVPRMSGPERAEVAARLSSRPGGEESAAEPVRYLRSTYVPEDEICFHLFEAESMEAVREASLRASLVFDRIVETEENRA